MNNPIWSNYSQLGQTLETLFWRLRSTANESIFYRFLSYSGQETLNIIPCTKEFLETLPYFITMHSTDTQHWVSLDGVVHRIYECSVDGTRFFLTDYLTKDDYLNPQVVARELIRLYKSGIIKKDYLKVLTFAKNKFTSDVLVNQCLSLYATALDGVKVYTQRTHHFKNNFLLMDKILATNVYSSTTLNPFSDKIFISEDEILLPLYSTLRFAVEENKLINGRRHQGKKIPVTSIHELNWVSNDVEDGVRLQKYVDDDLDMDKHFNTHKTLFNELTIELLRSYFDFDDADVPAKLTFIIPYGKECTLERFLNDKVHVGKMVLKMVNEVYQLVPLLNNEDYNDLILPVYRDTYNEYFVVVDNGLRSLEIERIIIDFYRHAGWDVETIAAQLIGGGYNLSGISASKALRMFYEYDVEEGIIVLDGVNVE